MSKQTNLFFSNMLLLTLSNICLLIFPISILDGFTKWQDILSVNPSLWSLIVTYASFSSNFRTRSSIFNLLAICFALAFIELDLLVLHFFVCFCNIFVHHSFITSFTYFVCIFLGLSVDTNRLMLLHICLISFLKSDIIP